jgi:hypothetical protein
MENYSYFKENVNTALTSSGALNKQNEIYLESIEAKVKQLKSTLDSVKFDLFMGED